MIHAVVMQTVQDKLAEVLIDDIPTSDASHVGCVVLGPLQGDPMDPDVARISVEIHENDPDKLDVYEWADEIADDDEGGIEIGGGYTMRRRFTLKARCLLVNTGENLVQAREVASTVRSRIEHTLLGMSWAGVSSDGEYVSHGPLRRDMTGKMEQAGGPPDSYDFTFTLRFSVLTTRTGVIP